MSASTPHLSVIVVTHNGRERALATLRSARASSGEIDVEWLVVDSGSRDGTADAIEREWDDVQVIRRGNIGFAAANNVALARTRGRYVLLLNPDVEVLRGNLAGLVDALDARRRVGAASVVQRNGSGALLASIRRFPSPARQLGEALALGRAPGLRRLQEPETRTRSYERECSVDWVVGAFLVVRSAAVAAVGPLDERFFLYSEETDWCYRLRRSGWDVRHLPVMEVVHHGGGYERPELAAQLSYSKLLFASKHLGRLRALALRAALVLRHSLRVAIVGALSLRRPSLGARLRAERQALLVALGISRPPFSTGGSGA
jgi:N-acetylglucosaminyl-diphospho-decaprenol L-rhamnosyltransferase